MWELELPGKNHWKKFLNTTIDRYWKPKMTSRLEEMKIHRFIGQDDLTYKKTPRMMKYAETSKEIRGVEIAVQMLCGEYPVGENLERTKSRPTKECELCKTIHKISVDDTIEHVLFRCREIHEDDNVIKIKKALSELYGQIFGKESDAANISGCHMLKELYSDSYKNLTERAQFILNHESTNVKYYWTEIQLTKSDVKLLYKIHYEYLFQIDRQRRKVFARLNDVRQRPKRLAQTIGNQGRVGKIPTTGSQVPSESPSKVHSR